MNTIKRMIYACLLLGLAIGCEDAKPTAGDIDWKPVVEGTDAGALLSVWVGGPDNLWFVGGEKGVSLIWQFDGSQWIEHDCGEDIFLRWVHGFSDGSVVVVGDGGTIVSYDGTAWTSHESGAPGTTFWGVWGDASDNIYAVGAPWIQAPDEIEPEGDVIVHYDGSAWSRVEIDALDTEEREATGQALYKVWGTTSDNVFIVGSDGFTLHFDGTKWTSYAIPEDIAGPVWTVHGNGPEHIYAVGGFSVTFLIRWNGDGWSEIELGEDPPLLMQGVWVAPDHTVYVSGRQGYSARLRDGNWIEPTPITELVYHAIAGDKQGNLYSCGGDIDALKDDHVGVISSTRTDLGTP